MINDQKIAGPTIAENPQATQGPDLARVEIERRGTNVAELARKLNLARPTLSFIVNGKRTITERIRGLLADELGIPSDAWPVIVTSAKPRKRQPPGKVLARKLRRLADRAERLR